MDSEEDWHVVDIAVISLAHTLSHRSADIQRDRRNNDVDVIAVSWREKNMVPTPPIQLEHG